MLMDVFSRFEILERKNKKWGVLIKKVEEYWMGNKNLKERKKKVIK